MTFPFDRSARSSVACAPWPAERSRSLSVVVPAYNEERRLPATVQSIHQFLVERRYDAEIVVVNDGSIDRTGEAMDALEERLPLLRVLHHRRNTGKGFAVRAGILAASRDAVLFCDADLSTPLAELDRLWPAYDGGCPVVFGSRGLEASGVAVRRSWARTMVGRSFNGLLRLVGVRGIRDTQCGFKLFRTESAKRIFTGMRTTGFAFDVEVLIRARKLGLRIAEIPVQWNHQPGSRLRIGPDSARMLLDVLRMRGIV